MSRHDVPPPLATHKVFTDIGMGSDGTIWAVDNFSAQRHIGNDRFVAEGDRVMARIAVGSQTEVWGLDSNWHAVKLERDPTSGTASWRDIGRSAAFSSRVEPQTLTDIDVAADGTVCGVASYAVRWDGDMWRRFDERTRLTRIAVGSRDIIWATDFYNVVQRWDGGAWRPAPLLPTTWGGNGQASGIAVGSDGVVWAVGTDNHLYQLSGDRWLDPEVGGIQEIAGGSHNLIGLTLDRTDSAGELTNEVWFWGYGPIDKPLQTVPPPPPPVATFASPAAPVTNAALTAPALVAYNRKLYVAYQGGEGGGGSAGNWHQLCVRAATSHAFSQYGFTAMRTFGGILMGSAPALAAMGGALYAAYRANDPRNITYVTRTYDGDSWWPPLGLSPIPMRFPGGTSDLGLNIPMGSAPALAEFGGRLYCAFQEDGAHRLIVLSSSDGNTWTTFVPSDPGAGFVAVGVAGILIGSAPALAVFNGRLYCAFQANDPSHTLFVTSSSDGDHWQSPANGIPGIAIGDAPALAVLHGRLYCAYQANDGSRVLCVTTSTDGARWEPPTRYENMQPAGAVTLCAIDRNLFVGFNGIADMHSYVSVASV